MKTITFILRYSHKKRKDSVECSLDRVLFATEFVLAKIPVSRLLQNTLNVYIECAGKPKHWYSLCDHLRAFMCLFYCFDIVFSIDFSPS